MKYIILLLFLLMIILVLGLFYLTIFEFDFILKPLYFKMYLIFINLCTLSTVVVVGISIFSNWRN